MKRLINIQNKLKAPKNQYNSFGKYKYRSCEDILEGIKPLLAKEELALIIKDEVIAIDGRFYVNAIATLFDKEGKEIASSSAYAREEETKKGMDGSQVTGASSSYARKYALNGLFAIDDTKDADSTNTHDKTDNKKSDMADEDIDIFAQLQAVDTTANALAYYKQYENIVKDKTGFKNAYTKRYLELKKQETKKELESASNN